MPERRTDRHSHRVSITVPEKDWEEFGKVLEGSDDDRSKVLREMIRAFLKRPGARIPRRKDYEQG